MENEDDEFCLLSDQDSRRELVIQRRTFRGGDRSGLLQTLISCARYQAVQPPWAADEMLSLGKAIETGERVDLNERFGWKPDRANARYNLHRRKQLESTVVAALVRRRQAGASFDWGVDDIPNDAGV